MQGKIYINLVDRTQNKYTLVIEDTDTEHFQSSDRYTLSAIKNGKFIVAVKQGNIPDTITLMLNYLECLERALEAHGIPRGTLEKYGIANGVG